MFVGKCQSGDNLLFVFVVGVWAVGNVGREQGDIWWPLGVGFATIPVLWYWDDSTWFTAMTFCASYAFDSQAKQWRRTPRTKTSGVK